jgi:hypothetical protein
MMEIRRQRPQYLQANKPLQAHKWCRKRFDDEERDIYAEKVIEMRNCRMGRGVESQSSEGRIVAKLTLESRELEDSSR